MASFNENMRNRLVDGLAIAAAPALSYATGLSSVTRDLVENVGVNISELQLAAGTLDVSAGTYFGLTGRPRMAVAAYLTSILADLPYCAMNGDHEQGLRNLAAKTAAFAISYGVSSFVKRRFS